MEPINRDRLIIFKIESLINGRMSLSSLVGTGSHRRADGLEEITIEAFSVREATVSRVVRSEDVTVLMR